MQKKQIYRCKVDYWILWTRERGVWGLTANGYKVAFRKDKNVLKLDGDGFTSCDYTKTLNCALYMDELHCVCYTSKKPLKYAVSNSLGFSFSFYYVLNMYFKF